VGCTHHDNVFRHARRVVRLQPLRRELLGSVELVRGQENTYGVDLDLCGESNVFTWETVCNALEPRLGDVELLALECTLRGSEFCAAAGKIRGCQRLGALQVCFIQGMPDLPADAVEADRAEFPRPPRAPARVVYGSLHGARRVHEQGIASACALFAHHVSVCFEARQHGLLARPAFFVSLSSIRASARKSLGSAPRRSRASDDLEAMRSMPLWCAERAWCAEGVREA
jgi:hypothetical protein